MNNYFQLQWRWLRSLVSQFLLMRWRHVNQEDQVKLQVILFEESVLSVNYLVLVLSSCAIATLGLLSDSAAVIIGAMIVAPLMLPIRGLALGALKGNLTLFRAGAISIVFGTALGIGLSYSLGRLVGLPTFGDEILARTQPNLLDLGIAIAAGTIGAFAKLRPKISDTIVGVAIAVALMPPVCVIGLGLAHGDPAISNGATLLYLTNLLGIALACMATFLVMGYAPRISKRVMLGSLGLTAILAFPLANNFVRLLNQARLETSLRTNLVQGTITFQRVNLISADFNWFRQPPQATLIVTAEQPITPRQVRLLEEYAERTTGQRFSLIFQVSRLQEVSRYQAPTLILAPSATITATSRYLLGYPIRLRIRDVSDSISALALINDVAATERDSDSTFLTELLSDNAAYETATEPLQVGFSTLNWWQAWLLQLPPQFLRAEIDLNLPTDAPFHFLEPLRDQEFR